jgi:threonylcarbamoyladenosine tRNA methylthiotransferase MtaB
MSVSHPSRTAAILTLGCKLNIADSEAMARDLRGAGWNVVESLDTAVDAVIVNSCSVTHVAERKSRQLALRARRLAPAATVAFTGCVVETAPRPRVDSLGVDLVYRQPDQRALASHLIELHPADAPVVSSKPALRTRAFISAQEGCNDVCAFCVIPRTRGRERSKRIDDLVTEARAREAEGAQELVVTGTQLGAYGRDRGARELANLLEALLRETSVARIRLSSVQPQDLSPALIDLWRDPRLCRHLHLALQSGSEAVLQRMRRRYTKDAYRDAVTQLRAAIPGVAITTDVIAGFPGETEAEFDETCAFCAEMRFAQVHVFPHSQRAGTSAEKLPGQLDESTKKSRVHRLIALGDEMSAAFRDSLIATETDVLFESRREEEVWEGLTDTYVRVRARSSEDLANRYRRVRVLERRDQILWAEVMPS